MMDKEKLVKLLVGMHDIYNAKASEMTFLMYCKLLENYEYSQVEKAVYSAMKVNKFIPKPADIIDFIEGSPDDKSLIAWQEVIRMIETKGYTETVKFIDPIISNVLYDLGGWQWICSQTIDELKFVEKRFREAYNVKLKQEVKEPRPMIGYFDEINGRRSEFEALPNKVTGGIENVENKAISDEKIAIDGFKAIKDAIN